ncbi:hypothetical protein HDU76_007102 [Blyttiomyces sp. JEL0837]|nr:hypothetical protein HDU76_007102 [Blyttiomyces sp. JEL0837]
MQSSQPIYEYDLPRYNSEQEALQQLTFSIPGVKKTIQVSSNRDYIYKLPANKIGHYHRLLRMRATYSDDIKLHEETTIKFLQSARHTAVFNLKNKFSGTDKESVVNMELSGVRIKWETRIVPEGKRRSAGIYNGNIAVGFTLPYWWVWVDEENAEGIVLDDNFYPPEPDHVVYVDSLREVPRRARGVLDDSYAGDVDDASVMSIQGTGGSQEELMMDPMMYAAGVQYVDGQYYAVDGQYTADGQYVDNTGMIQDQSAASAAYMTAPQGYGGVFAPVGQQNGGQPLYTGGPLPYGGMVGAQPSSSTTKTNPSPPKSKKPKPTASAVKLNKINIGKVGKDKNSLVKPKRTSEQELLRGPGGKFVSPKLAMVGGKKSTVSTSSSKVKTDLQTASSSKKKKVTTMLSTTAGQQSPTTSALAAELERIREQMRELQSLQVKKDSEMEELVMIVSNQEREIAALKEKLLVHDSTLEDLVGCVLQEPTAHVDANYGEFLTEERR